MGDSEAIQKMIKEFISDYIEGEFKISKLFLIQIHDTTDIMQKSQWYARIR